MNSTAPAVVIAISTILAYFIGGLPFGYWLVRLAAGKDIRTLGSGNIGATNVHRSVGGKAAIAVLLLDICKGFFAVWLAAVVTHADPLALALSAVAVMLGHCYPILLRFNGGKAVACFVGAFAYLGPLSLVIAIAVFILVLWISRHVSLSSIVSALVFPLTFWLTSKPPLTILIASIAAALLIIYRHRANIERLRTGTEHVFSFKGKTAR